MTENQTTLKITKSARGGKGWARISTRTTTNDRGRGNYRGRGRGNYSGRGRGRGRGRSTGNVHNINKNYKSNARIYRPKFAWNKTNTNPPINQLQSTDKSAANNTTTINNNKQTKKSIQSKNTKQNNIEKNNNKQSLDTANKTNKPPTNKNNASPKNTKQNKPIKSNKSKKTKTNKPKNSNIKKRPKPSSEINLFDYINIANHKKKKSSRKKLTLPQKVLKLENAFKIKEELQNHPYIIKQQKLKQQRIEYKKKLIAKKAKQKQNNDNNTNTADKPIENKQNNPINKPKPTDKQKVEHFKPKRYSSTKKHIKKGRIHKDVVNIVEYLVHSVCDDNTNEISNPLNGYDKKLKNKRTRQRKKEIEKLKKFQPDLLVKRNAFKDMHCGIHGVIMKYPSIRSYSNHLTSNELHDRVGFLLNKLSQLQLNERERDKEREKENKPLREHRLFLCGMKECIKSLRKEVKVIGVIMSSQMEPLPESSGLDKMIEEIKYLCRQKEIEIIYALNRKQLNYILKLKPWQGNVSCVTLLDVNIYGDTWKRIVEIKQALKEQYWMLQYDFIPIYRAVSVKQRVVPVYEREIVVEEKVDEEVVEEVKVKKKVVMVRKDKVKKSNKRVESKLSAQAAPFEPIPMQSNFMWQQPQRNVGSFGMLNQQFGLNGMNFTNVTLPPNMGFGNSYMNNNSPRQDWRK